MDNTRTVTLITPMTRIPTEAELAALGFLARYGGGTLELYQCHLKIYFLWCERYNILPLQANRTHIDLFRHYLETERRNSVGTISSRLNCVRTFYKFCSEEELLPGRSPAERIFIPKPQRDDSRLVSLSRHDVSVLLSAARAADPTRWRWRTTCVIR